MGTSATHEVDSRKDGTAVQDPACNSGTVVSLNEFHSEDAGSNPATSTKPSPADLALTLRTSNGEFNSLRGLHLDFPASVCYDSQVKMKTCYKCKNTYPLEDFPWKYESRGIKADMCKPCMRERAKEHYAANKQSYAERTKRNKEAVRLWLREFKTGKPCTDCGVVYPHYVMDYDHLGDKEFEISDRPGSRSKKRLLAEIEKCELVCANCHRERSHQRRLAVASGSG